MPGFRLDLRRIVRFVAHLPRDNHARLPVRPTGGLSGKQIPLHHLIAILSNHDHWRAYPITGRDTNGDTYLFLDHHMPLLERAKVIIDIADREDAEIVRVVLEPPADDCASGVHDWLIVAPDREAIGAYCRYCPAVESFETSRAYVEAAPTRIDATG